MNYHAQRGTATVEFAVSAMVMLMLLFGILQCSLLVYSYHAVSNAARQGSRWAMVRGSDCLASSCPATADSVKAYVLTQVPLLDASKVNVTTTWAGGSGCTVSSPTTAGGPGCTVSVQVSYPFDIDLPLVPIGAITLSSASQMVMSE
jgi:Flp pilus assembly protein TadG